MRFYHFELDKGHTRQMEINTSISYAINLKEEGIFCFQESLQRCYYYLLKP